MLTIKRNSDSRVVKCILHRVADIPGGVTINVANLDGGAVLEGTPLAKGSSGLFEVVKTAQVVEAATTGATTLKVAKGHHFKVNDYIAFSSTNKGNKITAIDKSNAGYDALTVSAIAGDIALGACGVQTTSTSTYAPKFDTIAIAGSNYDVDGGNLFVDAWVIGVVREANAPIVNDAIKNAIAGIRYV